MAHILPTSKDVYFKLNGKKVAVVQSYNTSYTKEDREVDAFGQIEPVGYTPGKKAYTIRISKAYISEQGLKDGIDFYSIDNFSFVISKPDRNIVYTGCSITGIDEEGSLNDVIAENIQIRAAARREDSKEKL
jgi:hypothetical protein